MTASFSLVRLKEVHEMKHWSIKYVHVFKGGVLAKIVRYESFNPEIRLLNFRYYTKRGYDGVFFFFYNLVIYYLSPNDIIDNLIYIQKYRHTQIPIILVSRLDLLTQNCVMIRNRKLCTWSSFEINPRTFIYPIDFCELLVICIWCLNLIDSRATYKAGLYIYMKTLIDVGKALCSWAQNNMATPMEEVRVER